MPSPESLRRLANLTKKVRDDLRSGGMALNFRYLFRSTAILARVVEILADHVATEAEDEKREREEAAAAAAADAAGAAEAADAGGADDGEQGSSGRSRAAAKS